VGRPAVLPASLDTQQPLKGMEYGFGQPTCFDTERRETRLSSVVSVRLYVLQYTWLHIPRHPNVWGGYSQLFGK
jgi:hypothetical protein